MANLTRAAGTAEGTAIAREGAGGRELEQRHETSTSLESASARAEVEARYTMAMLHRRDDDQVRVLLLKECARPGFARAAFYAVPRKGLEKPGAITGSKGVIEGLSVRFAEAAVRISGNILTRSRTTYDDASKRKVTVGACDLETNAIYEDDVVVDKTIERREPREGQTVIGSRQNSAGNLVYIVQATEEEIRQKQNALVSRVRRNLQLALVNADTLDECKRQIAKTVKDSAAADPDAERKAIADAFASLNVQPADLSAYLGHELAQTTPAELVTLRGLFAALREGELTWGDVVKEKAEEVAREAEAAKEQKTPGGKVAETIRKRAEKVAAAKGSKPAPETTPAATTTPAVEPPPDVPAGERARRLGEDACKACGEAMTGTACNACGWVKGERVPE